MAGFRGDPGALGVRGANTSAVACGGHRHPPAALRSGM